MNKKVLFTIAPAILTMSALIGCNPTKEWTVKFDTDGGTEIADVKVKNGNKVVRPANNPTKDGFTFNDWYTTKEGDEKFNFETTITADTTIYAHYDENWVTLADLDAAKAFVTSTYASKTPATMQSIDVTYDGRDSTSSGATTVNNNMKMYFASDYTDDSLYYTGNRTSSSVGTYFSDMQTSFEPIVTTNTLDGLIIAFYNMGEFTYKKKGSEFYIKATLDYQANDTIIKIEREFYFNSNGQCTSYSNDYRYEDTGSNPWINATKENCKFNY